MKLNWKNLSWKVYEREFKPALQTAKQTLGFREGIVLRYDDGSQIRFSEIAPWPNFNTETIKQALAFLEQSKNADHPLVDYPDKLPATAFALYSLVEEEKISPDKAFTSTALGSLKILDIPGFINHLNWGFRSFKWKLSDEDAETQIRKIKALIARSSNEIVIRLDANRSIPENEWVDWAEFITEENSILCIEEPMDVDLLEYDFGDLQPKIALDESLVDMTQFQKAISSNWNGYWIVKPSLLGNPARWIPWLMKMPNKVIISSAFETSIGLRDILGCYELLNASLPLGFGTNEYLYHDNLSPFHNAEFQLDEFVEDKFVWDHL